MRSYVALPKVVINAIVLMQAYYPPEFWSALERLEVIVDRDSFLGNHLSRHRVVKQRIVEELEMHATRWGFEELHQWHDRGLPHPVERLEAYPGSHRSWPINLDYDLNADAAGRPLVVLGDLVAAAIRRDLEVATGTNASPPIVCIERRMFPVLTGLGKLSDAEQRKARAALEPLWAAWGVRFSNDANVQQ